MSNVDNAFFKIFLAFSFVCFPFKYVLLLISHVDAWNDFGSIHASQLVSGRLDISDFIIYFLRFLILFLVSVMTIYFLINSKLNSRIRNGAKSFKIDIDTKGINNNRVLILIILSLIFAFFAKEFKVFYLTGGVEPLPFKLFGQIKIIALCLPPAVAYALYCRGFNLISLVYVVLFSLYYLSISGSKFTLLFPLLMYCMLIGKLRYISVLMALIIFIYTFFNPYAFREYVLLHSDEFNFYELLEFTFESTPNLTRILAGIIALVDRFPGAETIINITNYNYYGFVIGNMSDYYNSEVLNASSVNGSFAVSLFGYLFLLFGYLDVLGFVIYTAIIFVIHGFIITYVKNDYLKNISSASFYMFYLSLFLDGNFHLFFTHAALFYVTLILVLVTNFYKIKVI
ncbi:hypothetical protein M3924_002990 [Vibrio fluvialis]|nr:hypothetical protein [Vibrio fluvialis]